MLQLKCTRRSFWLLSERLVTESADIEISQCKSDRHVDQIDRTSASLSCTLKFASDQLCIAASFVQSATSCSTIAQRIHKKTWLQVQGECDESRLDLKSKIWKHNRRVDWYQVCNYTRLFLKLESQFLYSPISNLYSHPKWRYNFFVAIETYLSRKGWFSSTSIMEWISSSFNFLILSVRIPSVRTFCFCCT